MGFSGKDLRTHLIDLPYDVLERSSVVAGWFSYCFISIASISDRAWSMESCVENWSTMGRMFVTGDGRLLAVTTVFKAPLLRAKPGGK